MAARCDLSKQTRSLINASNTASLSNKPTENLFSPPWQGLILNLAVWPVHYGALPSTLQGYGESSMRVAIVGSTGVLGRNVIPRLLERGHQVRALVRHQEQALRLQGVGVEVVVGDIFDINSLLEVTQGCEVALHLATAIPKDGKDWSADARVRREGTRNFLHAAEQSRVRRYVQQSIVLLYGEQDDRVVDETMDIHPPERNRAAADMEAYVRASSLDWCIARGGLVYGSGTGREEGWKQSVRTDDFRLPGDGNSFLSLIHIADMARGVILCAEAAPASSIYNIVDDEPVSYRTLYGYLAARENRPEPQTGGERILPSLVCSNARAKTELQWYPAYPTFRSGLAT